MRGTMRRMEHVGTIVRWCGVLLAAGALVVSGVALADHDHDQGGAEQPMITPEMERWRENATPGEHHDHLERMAGAWTYTIKMWMDPNAPPSESTGEVEAKMTFGGRYLESHWTGNFEGMEFHGVDIAGFNKAAGHYEGHWHDNMGTGQMFSTGSCSEDGRVREGSAEGIDPMTGKKAKSRSVLEFTDDDHFTLTSWRVTPEGEHKEMEIRATRK